MDRRVKKTKNAIFKAFIELLSKNKLNQITVGQIIDAANVGRATFYSHFQTKDDLLKELCAELFCHIFDSTQEVKNGHSHIFECDAPDSVFLHLLQHLKNNDNNILKLFSCQDNEVFLQYFKLGILQLAKSQPEVFDVYKSANLPKEYWENHIISTFVSTVKWWVDGGLLLPPETINNYFNKALGI